MRVTRFVHGLDFVAFLEDDKTLFRGDEASSSTLLREMPEPHPGKHRPRIGSAPRRYRSVLRSIRGTRVLSSSSRGVKRRSDPVFCDSWIASLFARDDGVGSHDIFVIARSETTKRSRTFSRLWIASTCAQGRFGGQVASLAMTGIGARIRAARWLAMTVDEAIALHLTRFRAPSLICPWCHCVAGKIACDVGQIRSTFPRILCPPQGAFGRSSRTLGAGCGGCLSCARRTHEPSGRRSRSVLIPRRWYQAGQRMRKHHGR